MYNAVKCRGEIRSVLILTKTELSGSVLTEAENIVPITEPKHALVLQVRFQKIGSVRLIFGLNQNSSLIPFCLCFSLVFLLVFPSNGRFDCPPWKR